MNKSLFNSLAKLYMQVGVKPILLEFQYRMHAAICKFSSTQFYEGRLKTAKRTTAAAHLPWPLSAPLTFIDIVNGREESRGTSKINNAEAERAAALCVQLLQGKGGRAGGGGLTAADIGVIAPYKEMVLLLRQKLRGTNIDADTVDAMQGREKEVILVCTVRSNDKVRGCWAAESLVLPKHNEAGL